MKVEMKLKNEYWYEEEWNDNYLGEPYKIVRVYRNKPELVWEWY